MSITSRTYQPVQALSVKAAEDLPPFRFVSHLGSLCATETKSMGITETNWLNGELAAVVSLGTIAIETTTTISTGMNVAADTLGKAKPATNDMIVNGRALESCTGAGFIKIQIVP
jgi:hypothetical protein